MGQETLLDQIHRLREAFGAAAAGNYAHPGQDELFVKEPSDKSLDVQLRRHNALFLFNLVKSIGHSNTQTGQNLDFLKLTTFFARAVCADLSFWTMEINDDIEHSRFLFVRADAEINAATGILSHGTDKDEIRSMISGVHAASETFRARLDAFNLCNQRRASGMTCYSAEESPVLPPDTSLEEASTILRAQQRESALAHVETLIDRALLCLNKMRFVSQEVSPLWAQDDPRQSGWEAETEIACKNGTEALDDAETILTFHAARHAAFPRRLAEAQHAAEPRPH